MKVGKYEEISMEELAEEMKNGLIPVRDIPVVRKYLSKDNTEIVRRKKENDSNYLECFGYKKEDDGR